MDTFKKLVETMLPGANDVELSMTHDSRNVTINVKLYASVGHLDIDDKDGYTKKVEDEIKWLIESSEHYRNLEEELRQKQLELEKEVKALRDYKTYYDKEYKLRHGKEQE